MSSNDDHRPPSVRLGRVTEVATFRRSYRGPFLPTTPGEAEIDAVLSAGLSAPSSKDAKPWRLHVVTSAATLSAIAEDVVAAEGIDTYVPVDPVSGQPHARFTSTVIESAEVLEAAPLAIFIENTGAFSVGRQTLLSVPPDHLAGALLGHGLEILGIGGAIQAMWLAAADLGLAGVFIGDVLIVEEAISSRLGLSGDLIGVLALGYPEDRERAWGERPVDLSAVTRR